MTVNDKRRRGQNRIRKHSDHDTDLIPVREDEEKRNRKKNTHCNVAQMKC